MKGTGPMQANFLYGVNSKHKGPIIYDESVLNKTNSLDRTIERTLV